MNRPRNHPRNLPRHRWNPPRRRTSGSHPPSSRGNNPSRSSPRWVDRQAPPRLHPSRSHRCRSARRGRSGSSHSSSGSAHGQTLGSSPRPPAGTAPNPPSPPPTRGCSGLAPSRPPHTSFSGAPSVSRLSRLRWIPRRLFYPLPPWRMKQNTRYAMWIPPHSPHRSFTLTWILSRSCPNPLTWV